jgi:dihydroxy-acid dehydratase
MGAGLGRGLTDYGDRAFAAYLRRSFARSAGWSDELLGRPTVGICTTASDLNTCHRGMGELVDAVRRGVLMAGGLPLAFPVSSLGEPYLNPTSLLYRNLAAIDVEELTRAQPLDSVVLVGGCDKTVPALLMGAVSAGRPAILLVTGPMSTGRWRGERLGACTDCRRFWAQYRAGAVGEAEIAGIEANLATTAGTCAVMGTASTMAILAEVMGFMPPGTAAIPAVHADRLRAAEATGRRAVGLVGSRLTPDRLVTEASLRNALTVLMAVGGSTNALVHLPAIAGRAGLGIDPGVVNAISDATPVLVDLKPTGSGYMEDFHAAGGVPAVLRRLAGRLDLGAPVIEGGTLADRVIEGWDDPAVIRKEDDPVSPTGGLVVLTGSLAPDGAVLKRAAADPALQEHEGRAVVFGSLADLAARIDDPDLDVSPADVLVLQNAGPLAAGMPEAGYLPIPKKLARAGVRDMVRISDARMSGTAFGTVVLHTAPEAAAGGPLGLVRTGDRIRLSVRGRRLDLLVAAEELARRRAASRPVLLEGSERGWRKLWCQQVTQAPEGCDLAGWRGPLSP